VRASWSQLTGKQLQGFDIDSCSDSITQFAEAKWFLTLFDCNDPEDTFHFDFYSALHCIRKWSRHECGFIVKRDILHINVTSPWCIFNILCQIASGWFFHSNADATLSFCHTAFIIGFRMNSVGNHNQPSF
jgi:hypothetical protein